MTERRYSEDEIAAIFENATQASDAPRYRNTSTGLTLAELQEIGREVGVPAESVAHAAARLDEAATTWRLPATITQRYFGLPLGVGRTVERFRLHTFKRSGRDWLLGALASLGGAAMLFLFPLLGI
ncbi:MAG: hypothetical protein ACT4O1_16875, partial [Gemmatimonadota bacterium]